MATWQIPVEFEQWIACLALTLHGRLAWRLAPLMTGILFAQGRRTVASWLRAIAVGQDFRAYYYFLGSLGRKAHWISGQLFLLLRRELGVGERLLFALDDTPTKRYGRCVEGAGIHHNPSPGPADQKFLYGHLWVTIAWVVRHSLWGTIALPLSAKLYVRAKDVAHIVPWYRWKFQTKLELAAQLLEWIAWCCGRLQTTLWVVVDGAYAKRRFLRRALASPAVVVSRLRKDAALYSVPTIPPPGKTRGRGRPRKYGAQRISLAKRAGHGRGWQEEELELYGRCVTKKFKTFLATYRPVGGVIRVVIVKEDEGWVAFFCTDPNATVGEILGTVADRASIEQVFHDVKEVHGVGQQQVRNLWANVAVYHLNLWMHALIELWAWKQPKEALCDRSDSPWDDPDRRPSHADRRNALRRRCIESEFCALQIARPITRKFRALFQRLVSLAA